MNFIQIDWDPTITAPTRAGEKWQATPCRQSLPGDQLASGLALKKALDQGNSIIELGRQVMRSSGMRLNTSDNQPTQRLAAHDLITFHSAAG